MGIDWDAHTYDTVSEPQLRWGLAVLGRLELAGDERVLDAGCGTGRVTEELVKRLPRGEVVALDASPAMLEVASRRLGVYGTRVTTVEADLSEPLPVDPPVDAVLSTATFHWVPDHLALYSNLAGVMRRGAVLVAQCGGTGNVANISRALEDLGEPLGPASYPSPQLTVQALRRAGFTDVMAWLQPEPTAFDSFDSLALFLETVVLRPHLARRAESDRAPFVRAVLARLDEPRIDYVRLNVHARMT